MPIAAIVAVLLGLGFLFAKKKKTQPQPASSSPPEVYGPREPYGPPAPGPVSFTVADALILIDEICNEVGYDNTDLVRAVAGTESGFNPKAINTNDHPPSVGIMGIKVPTARGYVPWIDTEAQLFDPATNIRAGALFLKDLERKWSSSYGIAGVIQMYNLGETRFRNGERSPKYLAAVTSRLESLASRAALANP
jgi:hypothetical protein